VSATISEQIKLETVPCCSCGVIFAAPVGLVAARRKDGATIYCPNGHSLSWGESDADRLRKQLSAAITREQSERDQRLASEREREKLEAAQARLRRRVKAGTCPCCKRTFKQLAAHMHNKHPEFAEKTPKS
jgi:hypothetical protein